MRNRYTPPPKFTYAWDHAERRTRVTMGDYMRAKMERAGAFDIDIELARFLYSPVDAPRKDSRQQCRLSNKSLASKASKFLTLSAEYAARRTFARDMANPPANRLPSIGRWISPAHVASSWPSYREQQLDAIYAAEGIAGLLSVGAAEEITIEPMREAA